MNHCKNCNSKLGDFYMHSSGETFSPCTPLEAECIKLYWYDEYFEACVGRYSIDVDYFDHMPQRSQKTQYHVRS